MRNIRWQNLFRKKPSRWLVSPKTRKHIVFPRFSCVGLSLLYHRRIDEVVWQQISVRSLVDMPQDQQAHLRPVDVRALRKQQSRKCSRDLTSVASTSFHEIVAYIWSLGTHEECRSTRLNGQFLQITLAMFLERHKSGRVPYPYGFKTVKPPPRILNSARVPCRDAEADSPILSFQTVDFRSAFNSHPKDNGQFIVDIVDVRLVWMAPRSGWWPLVGYPDLMARTWVRPSGAV